MNIPFTLDQLILLKTIVTHGSFKSAAEALYISQPAVSCQVQKLERQLNVIIFYRKKGNLQLTETGHFLLQSANKILTLCSETCRALEDLKNLQSGSLILGASQTTGTYFMPYLIGIFKKKYPKILIQLHIDSSRHICWSIINNQLDLAIIGGEVPTELQNQLRIIPYAEDELVLIIPKNSNYSNLEQINKKDLYNLGFITLEKNSTIRKFIETSLIENGIELEKLTIEMELNSIEAIKSAVEFELGAAFVSRSAITKELNLGLFKEIKIKNIKLTRNLLLISNPNHYSSQATDKFIYEILLNSSSNGIKLISEFNSKTFQFE